MVVKYFNYEIVQEHHKIWMYEIEGKKKTLIAQVPYGEPFTEEELKDYLIEVLQIRDNLR